MTYNEWRDELKSNLLSVSDSERRRVLDYYAEAYADRRDAGFTEREIIEDFGAPYDAAQRILYENRDGYGRAYYEEPVRSGRREDEKKRDLYYEERERRREEAREERARRREEREEERERIREAQRTEKRGRDFDDYDDYEPKRNEKPEKKTGGENYTWVFVLLCIIFAVPLFGLVMCMVGITVGLCLAPFAMVVAGAITVATGIGTMFTNFVSGLWTAGAGLIIFGMGVILISVFPRLVKLMWKLFNMFFSWLRSIFSGKEA